MSIIALPTGFSPRDFTLRLATNQGVFASPFGGSEQVIDRLNDRWEASMASPPTSRPMAAAFEAFINSLRGMVNTVNLWHFGRPIPRGTLRGTPVTDSAGLGSAQIGVRGDAGFTLKAGDMLGANGLLLQVASDCEADGLGQCLVPIVNRLRRPIAFNTPVVWDRPTAPFRMVSNAGIRHVPGYAEGASLDFVEVI